jgi:F-type H+-transporting ATPase subunit delta
MNSEVVARRYAEALLGAASTAGAAGTTSAVSGVGSGADDVLAQIRAYQAMGIDCRFLLNPRVPETQKEAWVARLFDGPGGLLLRRFLSLLRRKGRIGCLDDVFRLYPVLYDAKQGIVKGCLTVAYPPEPALLSRLRSGLEARIKKTIALSCVEDPSILGGFVFSSGTLLMDASVRTRLNTLGERLKTAHLFRGATI